MNQYQPQINTTIHEKIKNVIAASLASSVEQILNPVEVIKAALKSYDSQRRNNIIRHYNRILLMYF